MGNPGKVRVAVIRGGNHRGAIAQAISLLDEVQSRRIAPNPLVIPNLASGPGSAGSTHRDAISATVDALLGAGAEAIIIAAAAGPPIQATRQFEELGYQAEVWNRPVSFLDLETDARPEITIEGDLHSEPVNLRIPEAVSLSGCRVSLAVARGRHSFAGGLGVANLLNVLDPADRARLMPAAFQSGASLVGFFTRLLRRSSTETAAEARWIVNLLKAVQPTLSIVDAFPHAKRSGPRNGRWTAHSGTVVAGSDPIAVDAVAALLLGYNRKELAYLSLAESMGLGVADLGRIEIVGDRPISIRRTSAHLLRMHRRSRQQWATTSKVRSR